MLVITKVTNKTYFTAKFAKVYTDETDKTKNLRIKFYDWTIIE